MGSEARSWNSTTTTRFHATEDLASHRQERTSSKRASPNGAIELVGAKKGEAVAFSWVEWPDKATRDAAMAKMMDGSLMQDPRMNPETNPMPFDEMRMIFGGFVPVITLEK